MGPISNVTPTDRVLHRAQDLLREDLARVTDKAARKALKERIYGFTERRLAELR